MGSRANHKGTKSRLFKSAQISGSENSRMLERATQPYSLDGVGVHVRFIQAQDQQVLLHGLLLQARDFIRTQAPLQQHQKAVLVVFLLDHFQTTKPIK